MKKGVTTATVVWNDALGVEELGDLLPPSRDTFLPTEREIEDLSQAVDALHSLFDAAPRPKPVEKAASIDYAALETGSASDYFADAPAKAAAKAAEASDFSLYTQTQRDAIEFNRFAQEFHAFARESQSR
jgi:hypothetical protein